MKAAARQQGDATPGQRRDRLLRWCKPLWFLVLALPLAAVCVDVWRETVAPGSGFGPDPAEALTHRLGNWALRMLLLTLAVSSLARLLRRPWLIRFRRMAGLWAFAYVVLHFTGYLVLLAGFDPAAVAADVFKRPYITAGFLALSLLVPLAVTSTRGWQRRLRQRWQRLHRLIYPAAAAAWIHLLWLSKASFLEPVLYGLALALLLAERVWSWRRRRVG